MENQDRSIGIINKNGVKLLAALTMLIDHAGLLLFPSAHWMRLIGRMAFPLFAFSVGEGCLYSKHRLRYFSRVAVLGVLCQIVYVADALLEGQNLLTGGALYFNVLLTFSMSIPLCTFFLLMREKKSIRYGVLFFAVLAVIFAADVTCRFLASYLHWYICFDYMAVGALLPLFAVVRQDKIGQLISFGIGLTAFCLATAKDLPYIWWAFGALLILCLYNGKTGKYYAKFKYAFYLFYPLHLLALYAIYFLLHK